MSEIPADLKYIDTHQWARSDGEGDALVGVTDHAQEQLGDVVFVELPEVGARFSAGDQIAVVESVKSASEVFLPVGGEIIAVNEQLDDDPELVNSDPYGEAWFVKVKMADSSELDGLLDAEAYAKACDE